MYRGLTAVIALAFAVAAAPASAASTFEGTCTLSGQLTFDQPIGNEPTDTGFNDHAAGTCTGTLNRASLVNTPVLIHALGAGTLSCVAGHTTSTGTLTFTRGT